MGPVQPDFYLASSEGYSMEEPRRAWRIGEVALDGREHLLLARVDPPLPGQLYGLLEQPFDVVLLAPRHMGRSVSPINEWPLAVHVAIPLIEHPEREATLRLDQVKLIAWAELYSSEESARHKE